jgi:Membrane protein involved in the export of O-antigen and teichoic acid
VQDTTLTSQDSDKSSKKGYQTAFKATALFGGTQILIIIIKVLKSKLVAVWLGTAGIGLMGLFNAAVSLISSISNLGLQSSAVKEIAHVNGQNDKSKLSVIVTAIRRWVVATGLLGGLITIGLSPLLSQWYFDNTEYTLSFVFLSVVILISAVNQNHLAVLQGTRQLKKLVQANLFGVLLAFVTSVPFLYFFRNDGIVWSIILSYFSYAIVSFFYYKKLNIINVNQTFKESLILGRPAVKLGIAMAVSGIMVAAVEFIVRSFIVRNGGIDDVGLYSAGWAINGQYLGLIFTAMAKDYFPRLSQISDDNFLVKKTVNQQGEIALLILAPMIIIMLVFVELCVKILYSDSFMLAVPMIEWLLIGSLVKAGSWGISFVFVAKGDSKTFLFNEIGIKFITLPSYLLGYYLWGLLGIGYAFTFNYAVYFLWVGIVAEKKYHIHYSKTFFVLFIILFTSILVYQFADTLIHVGYIVKALFIVAICAYCLFELYKRIGLKSIFGRIKRKK